MNAITIEDLQEWLESEEEAASHRDDPDDPSDPYSGPAFDAWVAQEDRREAAFVATLTATQRLAYLVHQGVLADECPQCHTRYVETDDWEFPDMVGSTYGTTWECCGHTESRNSALEYDHNGNVVDVR
jgi:hypothetical protein